jgi:hypothetical protein
VTWQRSITDRLQEMGIRNASEDDVCCMVHDLCMTERCTRLEYDARNLLQ